MRDLRRPLVLSAAVAASLLPQMVSARSEAPKAYVDDVALSRIYIGVHYRFSVDAGAAIGTKIGELAERRYFLPLDKGVCRVSDPRPRLRLRSVSTFRCDCAATIR
mgnify:FL=1